MRGETIVKKMDIRAEQCTVINFWVHLGKSQQKRYTLMREAYKEEYFAKWTIQNWHKSFSNGR